MTDNEIQQLAHQYAEAICPIEDYTKGDYIDLEARNTELQIHRDDAMQILEWLNKTHYIVEKETVISEYADAKAKRDLYMSATCINTMESRAIDHSNGRMYELNTLFSKSTFEKRNK